MSAKRVDDEVPKLAMLEYVTLDIPFEQEIAEFRRGGAEGIGITEFTGPKGRDITAMKRSLEASGMPVTLCWPEVPSVMPLPGFAGEEDPRARTRAMCDGIRRLSTLSPIGIGCITGPQGAHSSAEARRLVVEGLSQAASVAEELGVKLAIEPIHSSIADRLSLVTTIGETVELIKETGSSNIGVIFDVWHIWDTPNLLAEIKSYVDYFVLAHMCDWRDPTRSWCDRALPGEGIGDVPGLLGALEAAGYRGWHELEVLSDNGYYENNFPDSLWNNTPAEIVKKGHEAFVKCWNERKISD